MEDMILIEDRICSTKEGYPYAVLTNDNKWILFDHLKHGSCYLPVKEIGYGTSEQDIECVKKALTMWGWTTNGFEPCEGDLCYR